MSSSSVRSNISSSRRSTFATTRWSIVLRAAGTETPAARDALARLCRTYWYPLYAQVRRRGYNAHDAQDLTQEFFARLLANDTLARANPSLGRFRSYVLIALKNFLTDNWQKSRTQKRGSGDTVLSFDLLDAEARFHAELSDDASPDRAFDRQWALALLETVLGRLEAEYVEAGKARLFSVLKPALTGARATQPYARLAMKLATSEGAVKVAVHRLRRRYRELLEQEIADTVTSPVEAAAELQYLFHALADG